MARPVMAFFSTTTTPPVPKALFTQSQQHPRRQKILAHSHPAIFARRAAEPGSGKHNAALPAPERLSVKHNNGCRVRSHEDPVPCAGSEPAFQLCGTG